MAEFSNYTDKGHNLSSYQRMYNYAPFEDRLAIKENYSTRGKIFIILAISLQDR